MPKTSRLWKRLGANRPIFSVWSEERPGDILDDRHITSITLNRGSSVFGEQEHTIEVSTITYNSTWVDLPIHCDLTTYGMDRLNAIIGVYDAIRPRYFGRVGKQTIDDDGKWKSTYFGSKWQRQLSNSDRVGNQISGKPVKYLYDHFMNPSDPRLAYTPPPQFSSPSPDYGVMVNDYDLGTAKIPYSDFSRKYFTDPGFYVQNMRIGADRVWTLKRRWEIAQSKLPTMIPLTRSQVLSPSQWGQPNEDHATNHRIVWRQGGQTQYYFVGPDVNDVRIPITDHDISYIQFPDRYQAEHLGFVSYGQERTDAPWRIPTVEIDLLRLITSPAPSHRSQARQLLALEMGDPIFLSGDWHPSLQGVHFATGITEKISANEWRITLLLDPSIAAVGAWSPAVPARTWESAQYPWNDETRKWDDS